LALDPQSPAAHASLGMIAGYAHDPAGAARELRRAIALDPACVPRTIGWERRSSRPAITRRAGAN
jgi:hypothetical protein